MSDKRSLKRVLARQWVVYSLVLFTGFSAISVLMLYLLEDRFINRQLRDAASDVVMLDQPPALPPRFELLASAKAMPALSERMAGVAPGGIREFRVPDGRYLHVLAGRDVRGQGFLLSYDVSDQLDVNAALAQGWPWLLLMSLALAASAYALASRFVARVARQAAGLVLQVGEADGPQRLHALAQDEEIEEFSELARLNADSWELRLASLERERETLAFLGHELRTPLQSARTSLALLQDDRGNQAAWLRLQRALDRLLRASQSVLWLASDAPPSEDARCELAPLLQALAAEFAPLAAMRQQTMVVACSADLHWPLPSELVETVIANLVLNAIQHGGPGAIVVEVDAGGLVLHNPLAEQADTSGFGLGLQISGRLLGRFGWLLAQREIDGRMRLQVCAAETTPR